LHFTLWKTTEFFYSAFPKYNCKNAFLMFAVFVGLSSYNNQTIEFLGVSSGVDEDRVVLFRGGIGPRFHSQGSIHGRPYFPSKRRQAVTRVTCYVNAKRSLTLMKSCSAVFSSKLSVALLHCPFSLYPGTKKDSCNIDVVDKNPHFSLSKCLSLSLTQAARLPESTPLP
jgi:hypothetical protein